MATKKERKLINEITNLALDVNMQLGAHSVSAAYIGHIHAFELRVLDSSLDLQNEPCDWAYLSGGISELWDEDQSLERLNKMLHTVKTYHKSFDADGVKL